MPAREPFCPPTSLRNASTTATVSKTQVHVPSCLQIRRTTELTNSRVTGPVSPASRRVAAETLRCFPEELKARGPSRSSPLVPRAFSSDLPLGPLYSRSQPWRRSNTALCPRNSIRGRPRASESRRVALPGKNGRRQGRGSRKAGVFLGGGAVEIPVTFIRLSIREAGHRGR